MRKQKSLHSS